MNLKFGFVFLVLAFVVFSMFSVSAVGPSGATVTAGTSKTAPAGTAGNNDAMAGNVTEISITAKSTTQTWQGYYGNVTGTIQLADSNSNVMYNWTTASPTGEVYASTNQSITWVNIQCFNYTATGAYTGETGNGGTYSKFGTNLTQLELKFGINDSDVDGVNETFTLSGAGTHNAFYTANQQFTEGKCLNTRVYSSDGKGTDNKFEEALLYEPASTSVVFASILNSDLSGFDSATHDFEMLVLENGHGSDTALTKYYFFVELQ